MKRTGFSEFLHQRRVAVDRKWKEILSDAYLSRATLHRIRHGDPHRPAAELDSLRALAHALRFDSWAAMVAAFERNHPRAGLEGTASAAVDDTAGSNGAIGSEDAVLRLSKVLNLSPTEVVRRLAANDSVPSKSSDALPPALRADEMRPARMVPHFVSGVAASRRVEKIEEEDRESRRPADTEDCRAFTVPVDGDCQEPVWSDGDIVLFSFDACEREGILSGKSYYLAFVDGSTTFKRVFIDPDDPEVYILRCWNSARYPAERRVHFREVVRIARAVCKQVSPAE